MTRDSFKDFGAKPQISTDPRTAPWRYSNTDSNETREKSIFGWNGYVQKMKRGWK